MYNQFFTIKPRISEKNGGSKVVHLIFDSDDNWDFRCEILDYEDIDSIHNLDVMNIVRCGKQNCALQNAFEIYSGRNAKKNTSSLKNKV